MRIITAVLAVFLFLSSSSIFEKEATESKEGRKKYAAGDMEGAHNEFEKASQRLQNNAEAFYNLGNSLQKSGDNEGALNAYRKSLETGVADPQLKSYVFHNMGNSLAAMKKYKEAEDFYIRSLMEKPHEDTAENLEIVRRIVEQQEQNQEQKEDQNQKEDQEQKEDKDQNQKEDQEQNQKEDQEQNQKEDQEQKEEQSAQQAEEKEKEDKKDETMMQQFKHRKNLQISPFMLKKEERSKSGQTW